MKTKLSFLATLTLTASLGVAVAQTPHPAASPPLPADARPAGTHTGKPTATTGWNFFHIDHCYGHYNGSNWELDIYPREGGVWTTFDAHFQGQIEPACGDGNWSGVWVVSTSGTWTYFSHYDYK